jgi:hypothetical protein
MSTLADKIVALHDALEGAGLPHGFGGALALAWCTERARGTIDIDVNVFVDATQARDVLRKLPGVPWTEKDVATLEREGQLRVWWNQTPIDLFLNTTDIHRELASRTRWETFAGRSIPFLSCLDLAIFKAFFNRTKDWADLEEMHEAGTLNVSRVLAVIIEYLGDDDERVARLRQIGSGAVR